VLASMLVTAPFRDGTRTLTVTVYRDIDRVDLSNVLDMTRLDPGPLAPALAFPLAGVQSQSQYQMPLGAHALGGAGMARDSQGGVSGMGTHGNMGWWFSAGGIAAGSGGTVQAVVTSLDTGFLSEGAPYPKDAEDTAGARPWLYSTVVDVPLAAEALYAPVQQGVYVNRYSVSDAPDGTRPDDAAWQQLATVEAAGPLRSQAPGAASLLGVSGGTLVSTGPGATGGVALLAIADPGAGTVTFSWSAALGAGAEAYPAGLGGQAVGPALPVACSGDTCTASVSAAPWTLVGLLLLPGPPAP
jgi:hypothetical protein